VGLGEGLYVHAPSRTSLSRASLSFLFSSSVTWSWTQYALEVLSRNLLCLSLFGNTCSMFSGAIGPKIASGSISCCVDNISRRFGVLTQEGCSNSLSESSSSLSVIISGSLMSSPFGYCIDGCIGFECDARAESKPGILPFAYWEGCPGVIGFCLS
jgi:hypothetical protein